MSIIKQNYSKNVLPAGLFVNGQVIDQSHFVQEGGNQYDQRLTTVPFFRQLQVVAVGECDIIDPESFLFEPLFGF